MSSIPSPAQARAHSSNMANQPLPHMLLCRRCPLTNPAGTRRDPRQHHTKYGLNSQMCVSSARAPLPAVQMYMHCFLRMPCCARDTGHTPFCIHHASCACKSMQAGMARNITCSTHQCPATTAASFPPPHSLQQLEACCSCGLWWHRAAPHYSSTV
jgi:hypothetical protein